MTTYAASKIIGCNPAHVRRMCQAGTIRADRVPRLSASGEVTTGFWYDIPESEALRVRDEYRQNGSPAGWTRGKKRKQGA